MHACQSTELAQPCYLASVGALPPLTTSWIRENSRSVVWLLQEMHPQMGRNHQINSFLLLSPSYGLLESWWFNTAHLERSRWLSQYLCFFVAVGSLIITPSPHIFFPFSIPYFSSTWLFVPDLQQSFTSGSVFQRNCMRIVGLCRHVCVCMYLWLGMYMCIPWVYLVRWNHKKVMFWKGYTRLHVVNGMNGVLKAMAALQVRGNVNLTSLFPISSFDVARQHSLQPSPKAFSSSSEILELLRFTTAMSFLSFLFTLIYIV